MESAENRTERSQVGEFKVKPFDHQFKYISISSRKRYYANGSEQGTGKTAMEINTMARLWGADRINSVLILAPNGVHLNWYYNEIPSFMPDYVRYISAAWSSKAKRDMKQKMQKLFNETDSTKLRIFCVNWEAIQTSRGQRVVNQFCESSTKLMIVCDESHYIANPNSVRYKFLESIRHHSVARRIMSGTIMFNSPFDLFSQYSFLDPNILQTSSYFAFKAEYGVMSDERSYVVKNIMKKIEEKTGKKPKRAPQIIQKDDSGRPMYRNLDRLESIISPYTYRVLKKDCLDLPEKLYTNSYYEMTPKQEEAYNLMKEECRIVFEDGYMTSVSKMNAVGKLLQITSNFIIDTEAKTVMTIDADENPKLDMLKNRINEECIENGASIIVFAWFRHEIDQIYNLCERMNVTCRQYHGGTDNDSRLEAIKSFQEGNVSVFIAQIKAAATGITLTRASRVVYYTDTFSLGLHNQSEDRPHRIGQKNSVVYESFICKGAIDERMMEARKCKQNTFDYLMGDVKRLG